MPADLVDHPILAVLAFVTALPFAWPIIRAFGRSTEDDVNDVVESPVFSYLTWFPEWTLLKLFWLLIVLLALTITFYKVYSFIGGLVGVVS
jgi:hypothetical protein